jgi:hypothetical protein
MAVLCFSEHIFAFAHLPWGPEGRAGRLITGIKIFPPAPTGAEQGINPER